MRGLARGMFVSRLDRPWIETPFPLEGLKLGTDEDIERLRRICSYVYVDISRGTSPDLRFVEHEDARPAGNARGRDELAALQKVEWEIETDFDAERAVASRGARAPRKATSARS